MPNKFPGLSEFQQKSARGQEVIANDLVVIETIRGNMSQLTLLLCIDLRKVKYTPGLKPATFPFQRNITFIENSEVRGTILNLTLTALAPELAGFGPDDWTIWCQVYLVPVLASFRPSFTMMIPRNISCESYTEM